MVVNTSEGPRACCMDARTLVDQLVTIERYSMLFYSSIKSIIICCQESLLNAIISGCSNTFGRIVVRDQKYLNNWSIIPDTMYFL